MMVTKMILEVGELQIFFVECHQLDFEDDVDNHDDEANLLIRLATCKRM